MSANEGSASPSGEPVHGLSSGPAAIGLSILWAVGIGSGYLPSHSGIILLLVWAVAVPALVVEQQGIIAAFRRSAQLRRGKMEDPGLLTGLHYWLLRSRRGGRSGMYGAQPRAPGIPCQLDRKRA